MVDNPLEPNAQEPPAKKARREQLSQAGPNSTPTDDKAVSEEVVKGYLTRRPITTMDLLRNFMFKMSCTQDGHLIQVLADILKKINPHKCKVKGMTYLSLKDEEKSTKDHCVTGPKI